ncbi:MAG: CcdB protein, partial [Pseudomonadota bacterium]
MAQFDVFRLKSGLLVVDLQTDLIGMEVSRIVAHLMESPTPLVVEDAYVLAFHTRAIRGGKGEREVTREGKSERRALG